MAKRLIWKTIQLQSFDKYRAMQSAWKSSKDAFGKKRVMEFDGMTTIETNLPISDLRALARQADVRINWSNGVVWDSTPSWEQED